MTIERHSSPTSGKNEEQTDLAPPTGRELGAAPCSAGGEERSEQGGENLNDEEFNQRMKWREMIQEVHYSK